MEHQTEEDFKIVTLGDKGVGKTCLLICYSADVFMDYEYNPSIRDNPCKQTTYGDKNIFMTMFEGASDDQFALLTFFQDRLRPLIYPNARAFVVCFSLVDRKSFERVTSKWLPEIKANCPNTPWILVGNKLDLRTDSKVLKELDERMEKPITTEEGMKLAKKLGAFAYIENSAKTKENVTLIFNTAMTAVYDRKKGNKDKDCVIM